MQRMTHIVFPQSFTRLKTWTNPAIIPTVDPVESVLLSVIVLGMDMTITGKTEKNGIATAPLPGLKR